jgi:DNA mismatch endonuclease (patch repair protein)
MSANKGKNTSPELVLRKMLRERGHPGYRLHFNVPGRPDISYPGRKVAIFVNGCFWHRCPTCDLPIPKSNTQFWKDKFRKNTERDACKAETLTKMGWNVLVVWECDLCNRPNEIVDGIVNALEGARTATVSEIATVSGTRDQQAYMH